MIGSISLKARSWSWVFTSHYSLGSLFILALLIRVAGIGNDSLWYDEAFTAHLARLNLSALMQATAGDVHPPLWYVIQWASYRLIGGTEAALRLPSALVMSVSVLELYQLVKRIGDHKQAMITSALMAIMPGFIYYGQEARMYAALPLLVLMATRAVLNRNHLRFGLCAALLMYTQNLAAFYLVPLALWAIWRSPRQAIKALSVAGASYLAWLPMAIHQLTTVKIAYWIPSEGLGSLFYYPFFGTFYIRTFEILLLHTILSSLGLTMVAVAVLWREWKRYLPFFALAFIPPTLLLVTSLLFRPLMLPRGLLPSSAAILAIWGSAIVRMQPIGRKWFLLVLIPMLISSLAGYYFNTGMRRLDVRYDVSMIRQQWGDYDVVYALNLPALVTCGYYLQDKPLFLMPQTGNLAQNLTEESKAAMGLKAAEVPLSELKARGYQRAWVLWVQSPAASKREEEAAKEIESAYLVLKRWEFHPTKFDTFIVELIGL